MKTRNISGKILVIAMVVAGLGFGWATWERYNVENPTSIDGELFRDGDQWVALAQFSVGEEANLRVGTRAVMSSPAFPETKITGSVNRVEPGVVARIVVTSGVPDDAAPDGKFPCAVTLDSATAPVTE